MSETFFISDLHLDHKHILTFSPQRGGANIEEHNEWIVERWNSVVTKRDNVWVLGDVCFSKASLKYLPRMRGQKYLVRGNHDQLSTATYLEYFQNVYGLIKKHGFWLSHAPIHPQELRGKPNLHGHVHANSIPGSHYVNVCVEALDGVPISLTQLRVRFPVTNGSILGLQY